MSIRIMSAVWYLDLASSQKIVLLALADCASDDGDCWPSVATLARKSSKSERTVQGMLADLEAAGHITRRQVVGKGCRYRIHPRSSLAPAESAPPQNLRQPPQNLRHTPAETAPKPSLNHQEPSETKTDAGEPADDGKPDGGGNAKPKVSAAKPPKTERVAHDMPEGWTPQPFGKGTKSREVVDGWSTDEFASNFEHFAANHRSKGNKFKDWQDAWSTWVLNSRKYGKSQYDRSSNTGRQPASPRGGDGFSQGLDLVDAALAQKRAGGSSWAA